MRVNEIYMFCPANSAEWVFEPFGLNANPMGENVRAHKMYSFFLNFRSIVRFPKEGRMKAIQRYFFEDISELLCFDNAYSYVNTIKRLTEIEPSITFGIVVDMRERESLKTSSQNDHIFKEMFPSFGGLLKFLNENDLAPYIFEPEG